MTLCPSKDPNQQMRMARSLVGRMYGRRAEVTPEDYEDLVSEAFLKATEALPDWNPDRGKLSTFLFRCLSNHLRRYRWVEQLGRRPYDDQAFVSLSRLGADPNAGGLFAYDDPPPNLEPVPRVRFGRRLWGRLLKELSPQDRLLVRCVFAEGVRPYYLGIVWGVTRQAVDLRIKKVKTVARRLARRLLAGKGVPSW